MRTTSRPWTPLGAVPGGLRMWLIGLCLAGCAATNRTASVDSQSDDPTRTFVQARCGSCHRPPVPQPGRDMEATRTSHLRRLRLPPDSIDRAFDWLAGARRDAPLPPSPDDNSVP